MRGDGEEWVLRVSKGTPGLCPTRVVGVVGVVGVIEEAEGPDGEGSEVEGSVSGCIIPC